MNKFFHPYHLVTESPWPLFSSLSLIILMTGMIDLFYNFKMKMLILGYFLMILILFQWWRDVIRESTFQGNHTLKVLNGLRLGMILFIISEVMFFLSFFWSYFHMYLSPGIEIGSIWPPQEIMVFNPYSIPLINTMILLCSGISITWCHYSMLSEDKDNSEISIIITILLGFIFISFQYLEYFESYYTISDSVYGSIFFMITGFHGLHVFIGIIYISISMYRLFNFHYSKIHHFGFEAASWYWHFVDVIWLFLYIFIYWLSY